MTRRGESGQGQTRALKARISELEKELSSLKNSGESIKKDGAVIKSDNSDLSALLDITVNLLETTEKRTALRKIIEGAIQLLGLDTGALYSLEGDELRIETTIPPLSDDYPDEFRRAKLQNHPHIMKAVRTKSSVLISDICTEKLSREEQIIVSTRNMCSMLYMPLLVMQRVIGVVILGTSGRKYTFRKREIDLCRTLSNIGSLSLENAVLFERLSLLSMAVEQTPVSIVVTDQNGTIEYVNPKFSLTTGFSREEAIGHNPRILKSGYHTPAFYQAVWENLKSGHEWFGEMKNKKKNGEFFWENVIISPMKDEKGNISHFVSVKEDITEKKAMLENLISAKERAEESDHLKTAFLHNISHEIRTPLNAIVGFSTFLNDPDLPAEKRQLYSDIIISSNDQLLYIIDSIMKISHLETGQVTLNRSRTFICKLTNTLFNQFQPVAANKKISFTLDNGNIGEELAIVTDEGKLKQILSNLLDNAFKFTESGNVAIRGHKDEKFIKFDIADTGIGISQDEHEKIFERFYQVRKMGTQVYSGTGIGLSICSGYASLLGGTLKVESAPGTGSVFTLTLPLNSN
ncbi:MAG: ATP-binding protein [Chloroflexota bacterium]